MAFDVIVFNQTELNNALSAGVKRIALCDNNFSLPDTNGAEYTFIGKVTIDGDARIGLENESKREASSYASSYVSSYMSSYVSSYMSSYISSYTYRFGTSYVSGSGLFSSSGSFGGYGYSFGGSFSGSYAPMEDIIEFGSSGIIFVNGYGINLI